MKESDWELLQGLSLVTDLTNEQWDIVVKSVEQAGGVREVGGQARIEIERAVKKARTLVVKHPGQHDQSVHGGKGKGRSKAPTSAPASAGGGGSGSPEVDAIVGKPEFKAKAKELDKAIKQHRAGVQNSTMSPQRKQEAEMYLKQAEDVRAKMKTAKSPAELSRLHGDLVDAGENYKGVIREYQFNVKRDNVLGGNLKDWDIQEIADTFPIPYVD